MFSSYVLGSLRARFRANLVTTLAVALLVAGGTLGIEFYLSLKAQLVDTTSPEAILVLAKGATSEGGSFIELENARKLELLEGIRHNGDKPIVAREMVATLLNEGEPAMMRGLADQSFAVHGARITQGTLPDPHSLDVMVGERMTRRSSRYRIGGEVFLARGASKIVGVFSANGGPEEDEIWMSASALENQMHHPFVSSVTLVADSAARVPELVAKINASKDLNVQSIALSTFRTAGAGLSKILGVVLVLLALLLIVATSAIATTMGAAVAARMPELAALAAIGIRRGTLVRLVLFESVVLAIVGAAIGLGVGALVRSLLGTITLGDNPVDLAMTAIIPLLGFALGLFVGGVGGIAPSIAVSRINIVETLR